MWTVLNFLHGNLWGIAIGGVLAWLFLPQPRFVTWAAEQLGIKDRVP